MQSVDIKEETQPSSAQSTPTGTPQSSPKQKRRYSVWVFYCTHIRWTMFYVFFCICVRVSLRSWFSSQGSVASLTGSELNSSSSMDLVAGEGTVERWSVFGPRPQVHKSTSDIGAEPSTSGNLLRTPWKL